jgi:hypothetical protein
MHQALALAVVIVLTAGCGPEKEDYKKQAPVAEPERPKEMAPPPKKIEVPKDLGKCTLTASGAVTAEQETPGGRPATNVSYWLTEDERKNMMGVDGFVITCQGEKIRFQIVPGGGKPDAMPFAPKKYEIKKGKATRRSASGWQGRDVDERLRRHHGVRRTPYRGHRRLTGSSRPATAP